MKCFSQGRDLLPHERRQSDVMQQRIEELSQVDGDAANQLRFVFLCKIFCLNHFFYC